MPETITINGGGLTGLSLAIALRGNDIPVILNEAGNYPRHRVCGEFISGINKRTIETLSIAEALEGALQHSSVTWFTGNDFLRKNNLPEPALAISRYLLDDRLRKTASTAGVDLQTNSRQTPFPGMEGTVWCAGRKPTKGNWIGIKAHIRNIASSADLEMHSGKNGYIGITPVEEGWNNICGLFRIDRSIDAKHQELLPAYVRKNGNTTLADAIEAAEWRQGSFTAVAGFQLGLQAPTPGLLALGDSHSIIPPFTGNGMTMAFQSAETALAHLIDFSRNLVSWDTSCDRINRDIRSRFRTRLASAKFIHPLLLHPVTRSLLKHVPLKPILGLVR